MRYDPEIHHRYSTRLKGYDYSSAGVYFVTICVHQRECLLGEIVENEVQLTEAGQMVERIWRALPERFAQVTTDECIVMPNHFHGIAIITDMVGTGKQPVGAPLAAPMSFHPAKDQGAASSAVKQGAASSAVKQGAASGAVKQGAASGAVKQGAASGAPTVGDIMRAFKSVSAIAVNRLMDREGRPLWQRNYYERVIRNEEELHGIREYIRNNPINWNADPDR